MKVEALKKVLKTLIREEVKKAVAEEVSRAMGKVLVEMVKEIKKPSLSTAEPEEQVVMEESPIKTHNPKLNAVLNETARHYRPLPKTAEATTGLVELMGGGFDKIGQNESVSVETPEPPATKIDFLKQMVSPDVPQQASVLGTEAVPDVLKEVFKKDFRAVMKKMDEQKKTGGPGMINMSQVISG